MPVRTKRPYSQEQNQLTAAGTPLPGGLKIDRTVTLGTVLAIEGLWEKVGLKKTLADIAKTARSPAVYERALFAMTVIRQAAHYDGKWVIKTNDDTISLEDAACGYKGLMVIERCFRSLKRTQIKLTPMYHWLARRIESHVRICVLALLIERIAELACGKPWRQIRRDLESVQVSNFFNSSHSFDCRNELSPAAINIFKSLNISPPNQVLRVDKRT